MNLKLTITTAMIFAAIAWAARTDADVKHLLRRDDVMTRIDRRLARIEGALGIKVQKEVTEDFENDQ